MKSNCKMDREYHGSEAISMTYGEYLKQYPRGRKNKEASPDDLGYCIIQIGNRRNVCWITEWEFNAIETGFNLLKEDEEKSSKKTRRRNDSKRIRKEVP